MGRHDFYEIKRDSSRIDLAALAVRREAFFAKNPSLRDHTSHLLGLGLADM